VTAKPSVVKASEEYEKVSKWRDRLARKAAADKRLCQEPHPIRTHEVTLPAWSNRYPTDRIPASNK
jgi:hypothetical protein